MIEVRDLCRDFTVTRKTGRFRREKRTVRAVEGVSFDVARGEAVGYVGPNGAGKSTTIKMLTGILVPTSGHVRVSGVDPSRSRRELARRIGVVFGQRSQLWWDLPLADSFDLLRAIYRVPREDHAKRLRECVDLLELGPFLDTPVRQLSLGQRMRGEVTAALLHGPELLVLDEPTIGLDLESKERLREFLAELNTRRGTTLLLTTHDLDDIERLCPRLVVIDRGTVLADGPLEALRAEVAPERVLVVDLEEPVDDLAGVPGVASATAELNGLRHRLVFRRADTTAARLIAAVAARAEVHDLVVEEPEIDDVVRRLYARR
ncbi:ABC transporter ATP-binding protein [Saccharothrix yanglingensis]|uniref:Methionine ABC transporter ATP-binding protein n=1 Tax=Saccharothrix yanglingensis TaxID=659496 RepID=A0ABU0WRG3_9PSEU|nr:ATP-binding cassette domain-containing protein [Saccharothrix yanglingensis]MDQ2582427.1 methionine ABC transporter ATP-binding protein [Saccharothrix yanglingensis]